MLHKRSHCNEKPTHHNQRKLMQSNKDQAQSKMNKFKKNFLIYLKKKKTESTCNAGDSIPGLERSLDKEMATPFQLQLQYSCLRNPKNRADWGATVHGVAKGQTQLSDQNNANNLGLPGKVTHTLHTTPKLHSQSYNLSKLVYSF